MKKQKPEELLIEWMNRLDLNDWEIQFEPCCSEEEMELADCDGCSIYMEMRKIARIQIINPELRKDPRYSFDYEEALVHELLHLKFCMLETSDDWNDLQMRILHRELNDIARALVKAKRC